MPRIRNHSFLLFMMTAALGCGASKDNRAREATLRYQIAQELFEKGETTQGMSELLKAEKLNPDDAEVQNVLGLAYSQRGLNEEAERYFRRAIKIEPAFSEAQNHLCVLLMDRKEYDEAIQHCTKAAENVVYATPERAYHNMGLAYQKKGETPKAIESFKKGLLRNANFVLSRKELAAIYLEEKNLKEATLQLEAARKACNASPLGVWGEACLDSYYKLAMTYVKMKERSRAVAVLEDCIKADAEGEYGKKCRTNLDILR